MVQTYVLPCIDITGVTAVWSIFIFLPLKSKIDTYLKMSSSINSIFELNYLNPSLSWYYQKKKKKPIKIIVQ